MCAARGCGHRRRIAEGSAEWHGAKQDGIVCIQPSATSNVRSMSSDSLLVVQDQFGPLVVPEVVKVRHGGRRFPRRGRRRPRQPRAATPAGLQALSQTRDLCGAKTQREREAIFLRQCGQNRRKVDWREIPLVTSAIARVRRKRLPTSASRKRVLMWTASAPSRAQAKIAAR